MLGVFIVIVVMCTGCECLCKYVCIWCLEEDEYMFEYACLYMSIRHPCGCRVNVHLHECAYVFMCYVLCVCSWKGVERGLGANREATVNFSKILFYFRSRCVNPDFTKLETLTVEASGSLSHSLQDSFFILAV